MNLISWRRRSYQNRKLYSLQFSIFWWNVVFKITCKLGDRHQIQVKGLEKWTTMNVNNGSAWRRRRKVQTSFETGHLINQFELQVNLWWGKWKLFLYSSKWNTTAQLQLFLISVNVFSVHLAQKEFMTLQFVGSASLVSTADDFICIQSTPLYGHILWMVIRLWTSELCPIVPWSSVARG